MVSVCSPSGIDQSRVCRLLLHAGQESLYKNKVERIWKNPKGQKCNLRTHQLLSECG